MATKIPDSLCQAFQLAWERSQPTVPTARHEEGGYIVVEADGLLGVRWWQPGTAALITPAKRARDGSFEGRKVVGEFHTHPRPHQDEQGQVWELEPSAIDLYGIRNENYTGISYVIGWDYIWQVEPNGQVTRIGLRAKLLAESAPAKGQKL